MSCSDSNAKQTCLTFGSTGVPTQPAMTEAEYIAADLSGKGVLDARAKRSETKVAKRQYREYITNLVAEGKLDFNTAVNLTDAYTAHHGMYFRLLENEKANPLSIRTESGWLSSTDYLLNRMALPEVANFDDEHRNGWVSHCKHHYKETVRDLLVSGEMEHRTAAFLVGKDSADEIMWRAVEAKAHLMNRWEYISALRPYSIESTWQMSLAHYSEIKRRLESGEEVSGEIVGDYPDLVQAYRQSPQEPWLMTRSAWNAYETERLTRPAINAGMIVWQWRWGDHEVYTAENMLDARFGLLRAKFVSPQYDWDIEAYGVKPRLRYDIVGKRPVKLEELVNPQKIADDHRNLIAQALTLGKPVPVEILIEYPTLISEFGI